MLTYWIETTVTILKASQSHPEKLRMCQQTYIDNFC
jgi:hypothetical protein